MKGKAHLIELNEQIVICSMPYFGAFTGGEANRDRFRRTDVIDMAG